MAACFSSGTQSAYIYSVEPKDIFVSKTAHVANCGTAGFVISTITYVFIYKFYGIPGLLVATILADLAAVITSFGLKRGLIRIRGKIVLWQENAGLLNLYVILKPSG